MKNFFNNKKRLAIIVGLLLFLIILFNIFYNPTTDTEETENIVATPNPSEKSVLIPSLAPLQNQFVVQKILNIRSTIIKKAIGNNVRFNYDLSESEAGLLNSATLPTAYSLEHFSKEELQNIAGIGSIEVITADVYRISLINKDLFLSFYTNLLNKLTEKGLIGKFTIKPDTNIKYLIKGRGEYEVAALKEYATYTSTTYTIEVNNVPLLTNKGLLTFTVLENIKTKEVVIDVINFFPKTSTILATFSLNPGNYNFSPLISEDPNFVGFYANNDVYLFDDAFKVDDKNLNIDYFLDTTNNYLIPLVTKKAYLVTSTFSKLENKAYILVANDNK